MAARQRSHDAPAALIQIGANVNEEAFDFGTYVADWIRL
jgi:hypothetical protein